MLASLNKYCAICGIAAIVSQYREYGVTKNRKLAENHGKLTEISLVTIKNLLMPLFLMGCFPVDFQEAKRPLRTKSVKRPIKVGKRPINEGKRPIKAKVLVGVSVGCLMGCFRAPQPWRKTAPLKRPMKRSMKQGARELPRTVHLKKEVSSIQETFFQIGFFGVSGPEQLKSHFALGAR